MKKLRALLTVLVLLVMSHVGYAKANHVYYELACDHGFHDYTIQPGDTLSEIAQHYHQSMKVIASVRTNHIVNLDRIYAGRTMMIPCSTCPMATNHATATDKKTVRIVSTSAHVSRTHRTPVLVHTATQPHVDATIKAFVNFQATEDSQMPTIGQTFFAQSLPEYSFAEPRGPTFQFAAASTPDITSVAQAQPANPPVDKVSSNEAPSAQSLKKGWYRIPVHSNDYPTGIFYPALFVDNSTTQGYKTRKDIRFFIGENADGSESILMHIPAEVTRTSRIPLVIEDANGNLHKFSFTQATLANAEPIKAPNTKQVQLAKNYQADKKLLDTDFQKTPRHVGLAFASYGSLAVGNIALFNPYTAPIAILRDGLFAYSKIANHRAAKQQQALESNQ